LVGRQYVKAHINELTIIIKCLMLNDFELKNGEEIAAASNEALRSSSK
jgi:hypothetical protein